MNKLTSPVTQLPIKTYELPFCQPASTAREYETLGELLIGDFIEHTPIDVRFFPPPPIDRFHTPIDLPALNVTCTILTSHFFPYWFHFLGLLMALVPPIFCPLYRNKFA